VGLVPLHDGVDQRDELPLLGAVLDMPGKLGDADGRLLIVLDRVDLDRG